MLCTCSTKEREQKRKVAKEKNREMKIYKFKKKKFIKKKNMPKKIKELTAVGVWERRRRAIVFSVLSAD